MKVPLAARDVVAPSTWALESDPGEIVPQVWRRSGAAVVLSGGLGRECQAARTGTQSAERIARTIFEQTAVRRGTNGTTPRSLVEFSSKDRSAHVRFRRLPRHPI